MSFLALLKTEIKEHLDVCIKKVELINEVESTPEEILRKNKFKIKMVTPTSFGTQIEFAKVYDKDDLEEILKDFTIKIKNKSVFIVN